MCYNKTNANDVVANQCAQGSGNLHRFIKGLGDCHVAALLAMTQYREVMGLENTMCPVDVISMCSAGGEIRPLRLRLEQTHRLVRIDIDEVISVKNVQYVGIEAKIFLCRAMVEGKLTLFELKYTIRTHSWCLMRKVC